MKRTIQFFVAVLVLFTFSSIAQDQTVSNGPVPLSGVHGGGPTTGIFESASIGYGYAGVTLVGTISMPIPAGTPLNLLMGATFVNFASSMCKGGDGNYYLIDIGPQLWDFDEVTGATTLLGAITGMSGDQPNGLAYNPADLNYYMVSSTNFYQLDVGTLTATLIGPLNNGAGLMIDLCFSLNGTCWAYDLGNDDAGNIDIATGNYTVLGPLGYDANFGQGMAYDRETSTIYLSAFNNTTFTGQLRTMDAATGNTTLVVDWGFEQIAPFALNTNVIIPVELVSFAATVNEQDVTISWGTATETNNQGFEVQRDAGNGFVTIGHLAGFGTTTEPRSYTFVDGGLQSGTYAYRLKQIDFNGSFEYSDVIEVDVTTPDVFALVQNYPNPFNPSTKITFSLATDANVSLKVFNILGQEVSTLVNADLSAGLHEVDFSASGLNSGIYFYRIDAAGLDGTNFVDIKKMTLIK